jgi:hypothetical protein
MGKSEEIKGYEHYSIFSCGTIYSSHINRFLKPTVNASGYLVINLSRDGIRKTHYVHQLVAEYFLNHTQRSSIIHIDHIDDNKTNNDVSNLRIIKARTNISKGKEGISGHKNITIENNRYRLCLTIDNKKKHFGMFDYLEDAIESRDLILSKI